MYTRKIFLLAALVFGLMSFSFTFAQEAQKTPENQGSQVERLVSDHTPEFIKDSIATAVDILEDFRLGALEATKEKERDIHAQIDTSLSLESPISPLDPGSQIEKQNPFHGAWLKVELFFLKFAELFFQNKLIFYGAGFLILILLLRYIFA